MLNVHTFIKHLVWGNLSQEAVPMLLGCVVLMHRTSPQVEDQSILGQWEWNGIFKVKKAKQ